VIFTARGILVSLAFFAVVYTLLSLLLVVVWRGWRAFVPVKTESADVLFGLRVLPFGLSAAITFFLTFPSFLLLENHSMDEDFCTFVLCLCSLLFVGAGLFSVVTAQRKTRRTVSEWMLRVSPEKASDAVVAAFGSRNALPIMLVGIRAPRVLVSERARVLLTQGELRVAVQHEMEHLRSHDNLKRAILNFIPFPGMASLERAWQEAAELEADLGAVSNRSEALDLASALVKLSRGLPLAVAPALATGLFGAVESVAVRVERLLEWENRQNVFDGWRYVIAAAFAALGVLAVNLGSALVVTHSLTERLVP